MLRTKIINLLKSEGNRKSIQLCKGQENLLSTHTHPKASAAAGCTSARRERKPHAHWLTRNCHYLIITAPKPRGPKQIVVMSTYGDHPRRRSQTQRNFLYTQLKSSRPPLPESLMQRMFMNLEWVFSHEKRIYVNKSN